MDQAARAASWKQVERLLDQALDVPAGQRRAFVDRACLGDEAMKAEVLSLLAAMDESVDFLEAAALPSDTGLPEAAPTPVLGSISPYRLLRLLGRGGMGEVFEAERADGEFERRVAIKLIRSDIEVSAQRFQAERQILARLDHPGIAGMLDGGVAPDGRPYMVMDYVEGENLRAYCAVRSLDLAARIALFRQIAEAISYAHRHLIVHRDLKPANVLVSAEGQVRLLDFGIATLLAAPGASADQTLALLTPDYAAPELLQGGAISTATDIYALGLTLHELLTGSAPRELANLPLALAIRQIVETSLPNPSAVTRVMTARELAGDLDAIVAKALRADPLQRYASVDAMLDDLARWQRAEPVLARGGARSYRVGRFMRRHRLAVSAAAALLVSIAVGVAGVLWQTREAGRQRDAARTEAARANSVRDYVLYMFRTASEEKKGGEAVSAREVLSKAAARVRERFADDPAAARSMLLSLGELNYELRDNLAAEAALREFLRLPQGDPVETALAEARLADLRYVFGDTAEARRLLDLSLPVLRPEADRHFDRLADAEALDATLLLDAGDAATGIERLRQLKARIALRLGGDADKLANIANELGNAELNHGDSKAAARAYEEALAIYRRTGRGDSLDALVVGGNLCDALLHAGSDAAALACFADILPRHEAYYGDSQGLVSGLLGLGRAQLAVGQAGAALAPLERARALCAQHYRSNVGVVLVVSLTLAEALTDSGRSLEAGALVDAVAGNTAKPPANRVIQAMVAIERARLALRQGDREAARRWLEQAAPMLAGPDPFRWQAERSLARLRSAL